MAKYLYLPIEIGSRELAAKTLIAAVAAEQGFQVLLGLQYSLFFNAGNLPRGIYLSKGTNELFVYHVPQLWAAGHAFVAAEEENFGFCLDQNPLNFNCDKLRDHCDLYLCNGRDESEYIAQRFGAAFPQAVTGNARVDLLRPQLAPLYNRAVRQIRKEHGRFILVNLNFGFTNGFDGATTRQQYDRWTKAGIFKDNSSEEERARAFGEFVDWEHVNMRAMRELLRLLAARGLPVVVRPHPAERADVWVDFVKSLNAPTVRVVMGTPHVPYMLAADLVVHPGCTTGMEALLLGVPALSLRPGASPVHDFYVSNKVNVTAGTAEDAAAAIDAHWSGGGIIRDAHEGMIERLGFYIADVVSDKLTAERIVEALEPLAAQRASSDEESDEVKKSWTEPPRLDFQLNKFGTKEKDVKAALSGYQSTLNRFHDVRVTTAHENCFLIRQGRRRPG